MNVVTQRIIDKLKATDEGAISNPKIEQFALLVAEDVISRTAAWTLIMTEGGKKALPTSSYLSGVQRSAVFVKRLEDLVAEKAMLEEGGVWGRLEWQARQLYRKAAALNDLGGMQRATETLLSIARRNDKPAGGARAAADGGPEEGEKRGPGAPSVEEQTRGPEEEDQFSARLIGR